MPSWYLRRPSSKTARTSSATSRRSLCSRACTRSPTAPGCPAWRSAQEKSIWRICPSRSSLGGQGNGEGGAQPRTTRHTQGLDHPPKMGSFLPGARGGQTLPFLTICPAPTSPVQNFSQPPVGRPAVGREAQKNSPELMPDALQLTVGQTQVQGHGWPVRAQAAGHI